MISIQIIDLKEKTMSAVEDLLTYLTVTEHTLFPFTWVGVSCPDATSASVK